MGAVAQAGPQTYGKGVRAGLDATPLLGPRTGVGRYVNELLSALIRVSDNELVTTAFTVRGSGDLAGMVPPGVSSRARRVPARGLQKLWARTEHPTIRW